MTTTDNTINGEVDDILTKLENEVARDMQLRLTQQRSGRSPKSSHGNAAQAIKNLIAQEANKAQQQLITELLSQKVSIVTKDVGGMFVPVSVLEQKLKDLGGQDG